MQRIAIVGGGLAGLTVAKQLAEQGLQVEVYEGLPWLGGRASTYRDRDGDWIEQGLHLFLGTYAALRDVLDDIGRPAPTHVVRWMDEVRYQQVRGPSATYAINPLSSPMKTVLAALAQNDYLGPLDKLGMVPVVAPSLATMRALERRFDDRSVVDWWRQCRGSEALLERFLRPFCRAIQFTDAEDFSAYAFLGLVHQTLAHLPQSLSGAFVGARDETMFAPFGAYLHRRGVRVACGRKLLQVRGEGSGDRRRVTGLVFEDGAVVEADAYVLALPFWELAPRLPAAWTDPYFANLRALPTAPAISVQLWFDAVVVDRPLYTLCAGTEVAVYQDQSTTTYPHPGSRVSVIFSPADPWMGRSHDEIVARTLEGLGAVQPEAQPARLQKSVVLKHPMHLLRPLPGALSRRPTQATPVANLFVAGDWTRQDYFGSQEGAVRSGLACSEAMIGALAAPVGGPAKPGRRHR